MTNVTSQQGQQDDSQDANFAELEQAKIDLGNLKVEFDKLKDLAARAQADLQNAKSRMEREAGELRKFALEGLILILLPTIDNFQRAFTHLPKDLESHEWVKGVQAVEQDLIKNLQGLGLTKIESIGKHADPVRHEVLQTGPGELDVITEIFEDGYEYQGKVRRPAKVKVGNGE